MTAYAPLADIRPLAQETLMLDDARLSDLRDVIARNGSALEIDDALMSLIVGFDPCMVSPILQLLNETGDQDGMWSILHTAESFDDTAYVAGLLDALPTLSQTCLWWATTLIIRIVNSDSCRAEMVRQLRGAPAPARQAAAIICGKINGDDDRFHAKTAPIIAAARD